LELVSNRFQTDLETKMGLFSETKEDGMTQSVRRGLWTPWAEVLCVECQGIIDVGGVETVEVEVSDVCAECDRCHKPVYLEGREDVAHVQAVCNLIPEMTMEQTGGMCCNGYIYTDTHIIGIGGDGPDDHPIGICLMKQPVDPDDKNWAGAADEVVECADAATPDEARDIIKKMLDRI